MKKFIFYNVDTQVDFIEPTGALYVDGAEKIKPVLAQLTQLAIDKNITVINTCDWHLPNSKELSLDPDYINTFPKHCMQQSSGAEFINETKPPMDSQNIYWETLYDNLAIKSRNIIIYKDAFDVFAGNPNTEKLINVLIENKVDDVYIYGVATNVCVAFAVIGLANRGFNVFVVRDAICELPSLENPLNKWINGEIKNVKVISSKDLFNI